MQLLERDCADESADGAVATLFAAVGAQLLGCAVCEDVAARYAAADAALRWAGVLLNG